MLQFEVLKERLKNEYRVKARLEMLTFNLARWVVCDDAGIQWLRERPGDYTLVEDRNGHPVMLATSTWAVDYAERKVAGIKLYDVEPL